LQAQQNEPHGDRRTARNFLYHGSMAADNPLSLLHLGTSSFTAKGWEGTFYPKKTSPRQYLTYYAKHFDTLEVDATFYAIPSLATVNGWNVKTPAHFRFALKAPRQITHERILVDAEPVLHEFLRVTEPLGPKLAIVLLQFPYFSRNAFSGGAEFLARLKPFVEDLPAQPRFAIEIRNKQWLLPAVLDLLHKHNIALTLIDHPFMPRPAEYAKTDPITTDFTYIRWLGDRTEIEERTTTWDKTVVDRTRDLQEWAELCHIFLRRRVRIYGYANNHYGGFAPGTVRIFEKLMGKVDEPAFGEADFFLTP
jgi:uncharacterized protein YecE (DUF72 family)